MTGRLLSLLVSEVVEPDYGYATPITLKLSPELWLKKDGIKQVKEQEMRETVRELCGVTMSVEQVENKSFTIHPFFSSIEFHDDQLVVYFNLSLQKFVFAMKEHFNTTGLIEYYSLTGFYARRLFDVLLSNEQRKKVKLSLQEIYFDLNVPNFIRKDFAKFRTKILVPSQKEIHKHTHLRFAWQPTTRGKIQELVFFFGDGAENRSYDQQKEVRRMHENRAQLLHQAMRCAARRNFICEVPEQDAARCEVCRNADLAAIEKLPN
jgi:plasmid replication initiation protein